MENLLIVGIDPGTTIGYAILDLNGKVVELSSSRLLDFNSLLSHVSEIGLPVITSTDKKTPPNFVEKFATKTGSKLIYPEEDMLVDYKAALAKGLGAKNDHERDAVAAAISAYKRVRQLLSKIDNFTLHHGKDSIGIELKRMLLTQDGLSIRTAADILERPQDEDVKLIAKAVMRKQFSKEYDALYQKMKDYRLQNTALRKRMSQLDQEVSMMAAKVQQLLARKPDNGMKRLLDHKEHRISSLSGRMSAVQRQADMLNKEISHLNLMLSNAGSMYVVKKLDSLGNSEVLKKKGCIHHGDMLYVMDPSVAGKEAIDYLKNRIKAIIAPARNKALASFIMIDSADIRQRYESANFVLYDRIELDYALSKASVLDKVVSEYRSQRISL